MGKKKLIHFAENETFPHLFQYSFDKLSEGFPLKGRWNESFFMNDHPITLELGCGKGEYTVFLAKKYPERNFIGIDIKGARLWRGCKTVEEDGMKNVAFIRTRVQLIDLFFDKEEIDQVWITFPDPQPKRIKENKRLTSPEFLSLYRKVLAPGGIIHLKTDNEALFEYTLDVIRTEGHKLVLSHRDIYAGDFTGDATATSTFYEEKFLSEGVPIKYLQFKLSHG